MDESLRWGRARYAVLAVVCALHVILVIALIIAAKTRLLLTSVPNPIELLILPRRAAPEIPSPPVPAKQTRKAVAPMIPPSSAITIDSPATGADQVGAPVDWGQEAQEVAAGIAKQGAAAPRPEFAPSPSSPFALPPPHHKGDQIPSADGTWIVYVSEDCYQVSKSVTSITNAMNTGVALQTYCNRRSKTPRGDLFDQLPAYRRLHRDK